MYWSQVLSREWRCSWSSADRWRSKYILSDQRIYCLQGASDISGFDGNTWNLPCCDLRLFLTRIITSFNNCLSAAKRNACNVTCLTSGHGNAFRTTGPLWGKSTNHDIGRFPSQKVSNGSFDVSFYVRLHNLLNKQPNCWWFDTPCAWCHSCYVTVMSMCIIFELVS